MTEKELRDQVLLAIYNNQDKLYVDSKKFCESVGIDIQDETKKNRIFKTLRDAGYINGQFSDGGSCYYLQNITSRGIDYIELLSAPVPQIPNIRPNIYNIKLENSAGAAIAVGNYGDTTQTTNVNDAEFLKLYQSAIAEIAKSTIISEDDKEELLEALSDYKECVEEQRPPQKSLLRTLGRYAGTAINIGASLTALFEFVGNM